MANTRYYYCLLSFRAVHEEVVKLDQDFGATFSGVLCDDAGRVRALWGSYAEQVCVYVCRDHSGGCRSGAAADVALMWQTMAAGAAGAAVRCTCVPCALYPPALLDNQVDKEEREWCAGLPAHVFAPWIQRVVQQQQLLQRGGRAPPLSVR
jgi:pro-apoptotic serine protease NMA111